MAVTPILEIERTRKWRADNQERCDFLNARRYKRNREEIIRKNGEWDKQNPLARYVRNAVCLALKSGKIEKPTTCSLCDKDGDLQAHHKDYQLPLDVIWLCRSCHKREHIGVTP